MPNSGHAVAVDLHVRRHSLWASAHHITPYAFCSPVAQRGWLTIRTLVAFFGMTQGGYKGENPDARSATRLQGPKPESVGRFACELKLPPPKERKRKTFPQALKRMVLSGFMSELKLRPPYGERGLPPLTEEQEKQERFLAARPGAQKPCARESRVAALGMTWALGLRHG